MELMIMNNNGNNVVSSRLIAEELGKEHSDVKKKIKEVLETGTEYFPIQILVRGKEAEDYLLTKDGFVLLCMNYTGYNDFKRAYINEFNRMEQATKLKAPSTLKEALILALKQQEQIEKLEIENKQLEITKSYISDKKTATAMNTASRLSKENVKLEIELDKNKNYSTIKRMEIVTGLKFNWRLLKETSNNLNIKMIDTFDSNYGTVKSYHKDVWIEAYALDINM
ncbi:MAG: Rha family transcriptional regulator [Fusobacteriaceae bacterium]